MTELEQKDLVIESLRDLVMELQIENAVLKRELPTDESTRREYYRRLFHRLKNNKENTLQAV